MGQNDDVSSSLKVEKASKGIRKFRGGLMSGSYDPHFHAQLQKFEVVGKINLEPRGLIKAYKFWMETSTRNID